MVKILKSADQSSTNSIVLQNITEWSWQVNAGDTWAVLAYPLVGGPPTTTTPGGIRYNLLVTTGSTNCRFASAEYSTAAKSSTNLCNTAIGNAITSSATIAGTSQFYGSFRAGSGGTVTVQFAQNAANATATTIRANSVLIAYKVSGADYAELYYDATGDITEGDIVQLDGLGVSQIEKTKEAYATQAIGIASTKPGMVIGEDDGVGKPIAVALN